MFNLSQEDYLKDGYLNKDQFISALTKSATKLDKIQMNELFEYYAEQFAPNIVNKKI